MSDLFSNLALGQMGSIAVIVVLIAFSLRQSYVVLRLRKTILLLGTDEGVPVDKKIDDILVMCQSLVGLGQHVQKIEHRLNEMESNSTGLQSDQKGNSPYRQAGVMLDMGAGVDDLVNSLEMSQAEAKLFQVLHGDMQDKSLKESTLKE